jgi:hypothetical protein
MVNWTASSAQHIAQAGVRAPSVNARTLGWMSERANIASFIP